MTREHKTPTESTRRERARQRQRERHLRQRQYRPAAKGEGVCGRETTTKTKKLRRGEFCRQRDMRVAAARARGFGSRSNDTCGRGVDVGAAAGSARPWLRRRRQIPAAARGEPDQAPAAPPEVMGVLSFAMGGRRTNAPIWHRLFSVTRRSRNTRATHTAAERAAAATAAGITRTTTTMAAARLCASIDRETDTSLTGLGRVARGRMAAAWRTTSITPPPGATAGWCPTRATPTAATAATARAQREPLDVARSGLRLNVDSARMTDRDEFMQVIRVFVGVREMFTTENNRSWRCFSMARVVFVCLRRYVSPDF